MRLPLRVRLWLAFVLLPANAASIFMRDTPTGKRAPRAATCVGAVNGTLIMAQRGWGKALAFPHLVVWPPLLLFAARRMREPDVSRRERVYAVVLLIVNGVSIAFDVVDAWRRVRGERGGP
jgi:hypothetical protein